MCDMSAALNDHRHTGSQGRIRRVYARICPPYLMRANMQTAKSPWLAVCVGWVLMLFGMLVFLRMADPTALAGALVAVRIALLVVPLMIVSILFVYISGMFRRRRRYLGPEAVGAAACANCGSVCGPTAGRDPGFVFTCPVCGYRFSIDEQRYAQRGLRERLATPAPPPVRPRFERPASSAS